MQARPAAAYGLWRASIGAAVMQVRTTRANIEDLTWVITEPLLAIVAVAVLVHAGRPELAGHALTASFLMTIAQMGFWVGTDVLVQERMRETLELSIVSPTPFVIVLFSRIVVISSIGLLGLLEGWLIIRGLFGLALTIHHPWIFVATLLTTLMASCCTAVLLSALFSLARTARTYQNGIHGPLNLLGGVLVPVSYLPSWLQPLSPFVFLSWSAQLMRDCFLITRPAHVVQRLAAIVGLGAAAGLLAVLLTTRILDRLRRQGTLGLS